MRGVLIYNLNNTEDVHAFHRATLAGEMLWSLTELDEWLRIKVKHGEGDRSPFFDARAELHSILADHGIDLEFLS